MSKSKAKSNEEMTDNNEVSQENQMDSMENTPEQESNHEPTAEEKLAELNDRFLRLYADFENLRKRTNLEKVQLISNANASLMKDLLPVLDDFERAIASNENVEDPAVLKEGFGLIQHKFRSILESKGLKAMQAKGEAFDSELHEAVANIPAPEDTLKGKVIDDIEKGYYLNDTVIRFAKVVVGQ
ncbi:MAG: nucleotide exchange factor GrpE [Bacteroidetes bacterium]|nr:nucleotide exchange factor GrpE [Bacteroidota bacterium]